MEPEKINALIKALVKQCQLFQGLEEQDLDILVANSQMRELSRGKLLYRKGEQSNDTFCMLIAGKVDVIAKDGHVIKEVGAGEVVGEIGLSNPYKTRTASVITKEPVELLEWNIHHIKDKIPGVWKKLLKLAWAHMREYYEE